MLNFSRRERPTDPKDVGKAPLKPALYDPPGSLARPTAGTAPRPPSSPQVALARYGTTMPVPGDANAPALSSGGGVPESAPAPAPAVVVAARSAEAPGSKLFVGVNIKLKGVEISDCDVLVIEGQVEATVHSKAMEIAKPGTLTGTALIDVAEIHGEFSGELTARTRLVVHASGRVRGTIRYGKLVVAEGGVLGGDVEQLDASPAVARPLFDPGR